MVWEADIIKECPYSLVKEIPLENINDILVNDRQNKLFQVTGNLTICNDISTWTTAEGFYLTTDKRAFKLKKDYDEIKVIDGLMLSEMDFQKRNLLSFVTALFKNTNQKLCQLYKSFINLYSKLDDEFFTFNDFNGNEAILYSDEGRIFIPQCVEIKEIDVIEETKKCYKDFPVIFQNNNNTIHGFITQEKILKTTSKIIPCKNNFQNIHLKNTKRVLIKKENKTSIVEDSIYKHIYINLQNLNISKINFVHDEQIINSINIIKKVANISVINEDMGNFHVVDTKDSNNINEIEDLIMNIKNEASKFSNLIIDRLILYTCFVAIMIFSIFLLHSNIKNIQIEKQRRIRREQNRLI